MATSCAKQPACPHLIKAASSKVQDDQASERSKFVRLMKLCGEGQAGQVHQIHEMSGFDRRT